MDKAELKIFEKLSYFTHGFKLAAAITALTEKSVQADFKFSKIFFFINLFYCHFNIFRFLNIVIITITTNNKQYNIFSLLLFFTVISRQRII